MNLKSYVLNGGVFKDKRGNLKFINGLDLRKVKRFYEIENSGKEPIRAFHGHMIEEKFVYPLSGKSLLCFVKLSSKINPSKKSKVFRVILSEDKPQLIHIPKGHANGFKSLTKKARLMFFSTLTLEKSIKDDYRIPYDYWGKEIWNE